MTTVTATELARRTQEILNQLLRDGEKVFVERNQHVIAELVPAAQSMTARQALAGLEPMLTAAEAKRWLDDSRKELGSDLRDPWG
ncbi:MAG: type II toxin-antitoxin system Phd/YefM family antitoxin [Xanthomonadales bacterium]|nr:type II toxin-antitoxin system Phd/YefM family antitoxin [Xanthomonadales bacterium]